MEPSYQEIKNMLDLAHESIDAGNTRYSGLTYEEGVRDAIDWMQGDGDPPLE